MLHFPSAPDPLFKASKAPFLTLRVATPSWAPRQAPLDRRFSRVRKILAPIKYNRHFPPPNPKYPPLKRGILWTCVFLQKERNFSTCPYWRSHFRPQNCGHEFYGHEDFSERVLCRRSLGDKRAVSQKGGFGERTIVPVFVPGEHPPKPPFWKPPFCQHQKGSLGDERGGFQKGGFGERTLVPVFVPGEHPPKPPFWKPPFCEPPRRF